MPELATRGSAAIVLAHRLARLLPVVAIAFALWLTHRALGDYTARDLAQLVFDFPATTLSGAVLLTAAGYLMLAGYDWIALRHVGRKLALPQVLLAGFTGFAVSNSAGHALLSGGALRYRFYSGWGLSGLEIAQVVVLSTITYFLACGTLLALSFGFAPPELFAKSELAGNSLAFMSWLGIALLAGYWVLVLSGRRSLRWREHTITLPGPGITLLQSLVGAADLLLASTVLYVLLSQHADIPFALFLNAYLVAQLAGLFSQSPGGLGVFEGIFVFLLTGEHASGEMLAALIVYRAIYYLLPLAVASALLLVFELRSSGRWPRSLVLPWQALRQALPHLYSMLLLASGAMLLLSGTLPGEAERLEWLGDVVPITLIQASHLIGSLAGLLLLVLARGVRLKLRSAYYLTLQLLAIGAVASLLKGVDYEEAIVLGLMFALLAPARSVFYRLSRIDQAGVSLHWTIGIAAVLGIATWIGFLSYRNVEYSHALWFSFDLLGDAQRFLRMTLAVFLCAGALLVHFMLRRSKHRPHMPDATELAQAAALVSLSPDSNQFLALTGDKNLCWHAERTGFIAYVSTPGYWIAIGDPCGSPQVQDEIVWQFREAADRYAAKPVFYRVRPDLLPLYLDLGLTPLKLGEEALVDLRNFSLGGSARSALRHCVNRGRREGWELRVLAATEVPAHMDRLRTISDQWLQAKNTREKGISLGFFAADYLARTDIAVLARGEEIAAFANLWRPQAREEISIDLMRYANDAPPMAMDLLLVSLMLWSKEQGYHHFNLGMAPLSGFEAHPLAPMWHKLGRSVFTYGNEFYNFQGLRAFKDKFDPEWSPRYIALPSTLDLPAALLHITTLIAGGTRGVFAK